MFLIILFILGGTIIFLVAIVYGKYLYGTYRNGESMIYFMSSIWIFGSLIFSISPRVLGYGHVPDSPEEYTERLETGAVYQSLTSYEDGESKILLVKKDGDSHVLAIRVKGPIPLEHFRLVDGKPVAIN